MISKPSLLREVIGDVLRRARTTQHRTLREVSDAARVSLGYLSEVERGLKEASSELLNAICEALDVPLSELYALHGLLPRPGGRGQLLVGRGRVSPCRPGPHGDRAGLAGHPHPRAGVSEQGTALGAGIDLCDRRACGGLPDRAPLFADTLDQSLLYSDNAHPLLSALILGAPL